MINNGSINSFSASKRQCNVINETKEEKKYKMMIILVSKYYDKIKNQIIKKVEKGENKLIFHLNYYDFLNDKLGHPQLIMTQLMYELLYEYSEFLKKMNYTTLQVYCNNTLRFTLRGKNIIIFEW